MSAAQRMLDYAIGGILELVTKIRVRDDGTFTAKGMLNTDIEGGVGWHFGFYSRPNDDAATGFVVNAAGKRATSLLVAFRDRQYELALGKGEVGIQNAFGASTLWDKNGNVVTKPGNGGKVQLGAATGNEPAVLGNALENRLANLEAKFNGHSHIVSGTNTCPAGGGSIAGTGAAIVPVQQVPSPGPNIKSNIVEIKG